MLCSIHTITATPTNHTNMHAPAAMSPPCVSPWATPGCPLWCGSRRAFWRVPQPVGGGAPPQLAPRHLQRAPATPGCHLRWAEVEGGSLGRGGGLGVGASSLPYSCGVVGSCNITNSAQCVYTCAHVLPWAAGAVLERVQVASRFSHDMVGASAAAAARAVDRERAEMCGYQRYTMRVLVLVGARRTGLDTDKRSHWRHPCHTLQHICCSCLCVHGDQQVATSHLTCIRRVGCTVSDRAADHCTRWRLLVLGVRR